MVMNNHRHNFTRIRKFKRFNATTLRLAIMDLPSEIFFDSEQTDYCYEDTDQCVTML